MKSIPVIASIALALFSGTAFSTTRFIACPVSGKTIDDQYKVADVVVIATPVAISIRDKKGNPFGQRTVLWKTNESWKGPYKGATFTTREPINCDLRDQMCREFGDWLLATGHPMLLFLAGKEPYELGQRACNTTGFLEESIPALEKLLILRRSWYK